MKKVGIGSRGANPCGEGVFEHIAREPCVFAYCDFAFSAFLIIICAEESADFIRVLDGEGDVCLAAKSVCAEIFSHIKRSPDFLLVLGCFHF